VQCSSEKLATNGRICSLKSTTLLFKATLVHRQPGQDMIPVEFLVIQFVGQTYFLDRCIASNRTTTACLLSAFDSANKMTRASSKLRPRSRCRDLIRGCVHKERSRRFHVLSLIRLSVTNDKPSTSRPWVLGVPGPRNECHPRALLVTFCSTDETLDKTVSA
jgi:hypothetical protein